LSLISAIDAAKNDPSIGGIAVNTSGMSVNKVMLWELREKLKNFKSTGKHVIVFIDRSTIREYHFASVADRIVLDPTGFLILEGYVTGRTFLKGTLEKLGIGFDEWRFFKYKSANEPFSRDAMSEADREQRQALVDGFYKLARLDISEARGVSAEQFDRLVDETTIFLPQQALEEGLVDTIGRWGAVEDMISQLEGEPKGFVGEGSLAEFRLPKDNAWSEDPRIAIVYAIGPTAMDVGIKARQLVKDVEAVRRDQRVKAVILRVDSPGGDGTAADVIAEAIKECKKEKPVIVSQGAVAASGGYWLSMYADTIVAAPNTITGSIGVTGGWFYDKGLKGKLGMSTDFVKKGEHADIGFGFVMPFVGIGLPDRNLTLDERRKIQSAIETFYEDFVKKVAAGRGKAFDEIDTIGQGRVWSGYEAKQIGLVDVLGGLATAINIAKEKAGLPKYQDVEIAEYPKKGLIDPSILLPKLFGVEIAKDKNELLEYLKLRLKHNGQPMPILPMDLVDFREESED
jgi:protease-4